MLKLLFLLLDLGIHIDEVADRYGKLVGLYHEGRSVSRFLGFDLDLAEVGHLCDDGIVCGISVLADGDQHERLTGRDLLLVTDRTHASYDELHTLDRVDKRFSSSVGAARVRVAFMMLSPG